MEKKKISGKTFLIILVLASIGILAAIGTYAYFGWSSTEVNKDATVSVTSVNGLGQCNKSSDNQKILWPVTNRNNGRIVTVSTKQTLSEYAYIVWTLTIDSINTQETETSGLKHQSFKYELVNTTTGVSYGSGNFQNLDVGDTITFSNNTENLAYDTNYTFTLYLWIDGTIGANPMDMTDQTYQFSLVCDITGEPTNKVHEILPNPITDYEYEIGTGDLTGYVVLKKYIGTSPDVIIPDTYKINGIDYGIAFYHHENALPRPPEGPFCANTMIQRVTLPSNYKYVYSNYYNNREVSDNTSLRGMFYGCTSLLDVSGIPNSVTNMAYTFYGCTSLVTAPEIPSSTISMQGTFENCTSLVNAPTIPSSVTSMYSTFSGCTSLVNAPTIPSSVTSMYSTFSGCTSLVTAPEIPNSVVSMEFTFSGCTALVTASTIPSSVTRMAKTFSGCSNLTGTIKIYSENIRIYHPAGYSTTAIEYQPFYNTEKPITVEVPAGSTTYTTLTSNNISNVTISTFTPE